MIEHRQLQAEIGTLSISLERVLLFEQAMAEGDKNPQFPHRELWKIDL